MGKSTKERELELKLAILQIEHERECVKNLLDYQRSVRETKRKMDNMIGYMSIGGLIVTIIFCVVCMITLR